MTTFSSFQEIIRQLCRSHKLLLHESGGTSFIPMAKDDESPAAIQDIKQTYVKLMFVTIAGRTESELNWDAQIRFIQNIDQGADQEAATEQARDITLRIALDFDARIRWEWQERDEDSRCYFINSMGEPSLTPIGLVDQTGIGWDMTIRFDTDRPAYDPAKWID